MSCTIKFKSESEAEIGLRTMLFKNQYKVKLCSKCNKFHIEKKEEWNEEIMSPPAQEAIPLASRSEAGIERNEIEG